MTPLLPPNMQPTASHASKTVSPSSHPAQVSSSGSGGVPSVSEFSAVIRQVVSDLKSSTPQRTNRTVSTEGHDPTGTPLPVPGTKGPAGPSTEVPQDKLNVPGKGSDAVIAGKNTGPTEAPPSVSQASGQRDMPITTQPLHVATVSSKAEGGKSQKTDKKMPNSAASTPSAGGVPPQVIPAPVLPMTASAGSKPAVSSSSRHSTGGSQGGATVQGASPQQVTTGVLAATATNKSSRLEQALPASAEHVATGTPSAAFVLPMGSSQAPVSNALSHSAQATEVQVQTPVMDSQFSSALGQHLLILTGQQVQTARLHVSPPELGPIAVEIRMQSHDQVSVSMVVSHASTHEVLSQSLGALHDSFAAQGMQLQTSLSGGQGQGQGQQAPTREEWLHSTQAPSGSSAEIAKMSPLAQAANSLNSQSLLDLYA